MPNSEHERTVAFWPSLLVLFFASGFSGLVYEATWMRMLTDVLGSTVWSVSTVLSIFMGGMAVGSFCFGKWADRWNGATALRAFAYTQFGIAVSAALVPVALDCVGPLYVWLYRSVGPSSELLRMVRAFVSALVLLPPTILMGGTLPVMCRCLARRRETFGRDVGILYSVNTLGGVAGCSLAGFRLIETLGLRGTSYRAALVNLLVAGAAWLLSRQSRPEDPPEPVCDGVAEEPAAVVRDGSAKRAMILASAVAGLSGFTALGYEVLWTRVLVFFLGNTVYSFSIILITFLVGIVLGAYVLGKLADRTGSPAFLLGVVQSCIGVLAVASPWVLHLVFRLLTSSTRLYGRPTFPSTLNAFVATAAGFLLPAMLMGGTVPIALKWFRLWHRSSSRTAGTVVGANTIGAAIGPLVAGFVLIPWLGVYRSILALALVNGVAGLTVAIDRRPSRAPKTRLAIPSVAIALSAILCLCPINPLTRYFTQTVGGRVVAIREGRDCTVTVTDAGQRLLGIDGSLMACAHFDMTLRAHLAMLLHPDPHRVLVVGFGTGTTAGTVATRYPTAQVDCVEVSPTVVSCAPFFERWNHGVIANDRVTVIIEDAKNHAVCTNKRYDVIISDPPHPFGAHGAALYGWEYYTACKERLAPGGVLLQWVPLYMAPAQELALMARTFLNVFPDLTLWGSASPVSVHWATVKGELRLSVGQMQARMERNGILDDLRNGGIDGARSLIDKLFIMDASCARYWIGDGPLITDDRPIIEFSIPRYLGKSTPRARPFLLPDLLAHRTSPDPYLLP